MGKDIICWWSGGVTSAVACRLAINLYGRDRCNIIMIDTYNEDDDTYRFKTDCEKWYGLPISTITAIGNGYNSIHDVWYKFESLNVAHGAICSSELKRQVRIKWEKENTFTHQVFGFDISEPIRAKSMSINYPKVKAIYPLLDHRLSKNDCIKMIIEHGIEIPNSYKYGFNNNNCLQTGCVQGGIGYWQKIKRELPNRFFKMAQVEHELTAMANKPITMLKDQSKVAKNSGNFQVFLLPHPDYPNHKCLADMKGREPKPLLECNGFGCAVNDMQKPNPTQNEINFDKQK